MNYDPYWKSSPMTWARLKDAARQNRKAPTRAEALLWDLLRGGRMAGSKIRRQHSIGPYIVDFYCASARLVIEVDGPIHTETQEQDEQRTRFLEAMRLRVIRITNQQIIEEPESVLATIRSYCADPPLRGDGEGAGG